MHSSFKEEVVGICASILAKACRPSACLIQHIILYAGHSIRCGVLCHVCERVCCILYYTHTDAENYVLF